MKWIAILLLFCCTASAQVVPFAFLGKRPSSTAASSISATAWLSHDGNSPGTQVTDTLLTSGTIFGSASASDSWDFTSLSGSAISTNFHYTNLHFALDRTITIDGTVYNPATKTNSIAYTHNPQWQIARYILSPRPHIISVGVVFKLGPYSNDGSSYDLVFIAAQSTFCSMNLTDRGTGTNYFITAHGQGSLNPCDGGAESGCRIQVTTNVAYFGELMMFNTDAPYYGTNIAVRVTRISDWTLIGESIYPAVDASNVALTTDNVVAVVVGQDGHPVGNNETTIFGDVIIDRAGGFPLRR